MLGRDGEKYKQGGVNILHSLSSPVYRAKEGANGKLHPEAFRWQRTTWQ
jgi:hypothetical protein